MTDTTEPTLADLTTEVTEAAEPTTLTAEQFIAGARPLLAMLGLTMLLGLHTEATEALATLMVGFDAFAEGQNL